jgi:anaerobic nitric oxide reductase transcription regulator
VIARWIHHCSARASKPFIAVNCAAVQSDLAESLFFGVRKGSFTGADSDRPGWFQAADGGTLFMDELGDIPPPVQAKLLRAAESGEVQRLGSVAMEHVDIRIISATGKDLEAEMKAGRFRADFYFRLAQVSIRIPPLDERRCDIGPLANFFLDRLRGGAILEPPAISTDGLAWLMTRSWPGNARELRAFIERAAWHGAGTVLDSSFFKTLVSGTTAPGQRPLLPVLTSAQIPGTRMPLKEARIAFERSYVIKVLAESGGSVTQAAAALGILPNNLSRKMKELGISPE